MKRVFLLMAFSVLAAVAVANPAVVVEDAWVREAPPGAPMLAAYMTLNNQTPEEQVLIDVTSPAFSHVMLHQSRIVDGVARMVHLDELVIPAQDSVKLEPGGLHLMMPAPEIRLSAGDRVEFILKFADGRSIRVQAIVAKKP
jgi:copper(I)-binding protein